MQKSKLATTTIFFVLLAVVVTAGNRHNYHDESYNYYSADGKFNNFGNPWFGATGAYLSYADPHIKPVDFSRYASAPSGRAISNTLSAAPHEQTRVSPRNTTEFLTAWAKFVEHDIVYTPTGNVLAPIAVPACDRYFDPDCNGTVKLAFKRSVVRGGKYAFPNDVTSWIDGSQIYGSSYQTQRVLRAYSHGRLKVSAAEYLPDEGEYPPLVSEIPAQDRKYVNMTYLATALPQEHLFACGDVRCNDNPIVLSLHILFLREHNRVAGVLKQNYPYWNDEKLFQKARAYVIAELQHITFSEYLFWLLGGRPFVKYTGYKSWINPNIHAVFSSVAFRYSDSELNEHIKRLLSDEGDARTSYSLLSENFYDNGLTYQDGIGPIFLGMVSQAPLSSDNQFTGGVRNEYLRGTGPRVADLFAFDIQRARDHGIPQYNVIRKAYGLPTVSSWANFRSLDLDDEVNRNEIISQLSALYATPNDCDAFACGICEDWVTTKASAAHDDFSNLGELFEAILIKQFANIRDGDRLWYEATGNLRRIDNLRGLEHIKLRRLSHVIRDNIPGITIQEDVFHNEDLLGISRLALGLNENPAQ